MTAHRSVYELDKNATGQEIAKANLEIRKRRSEASRRDAQWDALLATDEFQAYLAGRGFELREKWPAIPADVFTESATLGAMLSNGRSARKVIAELRPAHFWVASHRHIFKACQLVNKDASNGERVKIDIITVADKLRSLGQLDEIGGAQRLMKCIEDCPSSINSAAYIKILKATARRRFLFQMCQIATGESIAPDANDSFVISRLRRGLDEIEMHSLCNAKTLFEPTK